MFYGSLNIIDIQRFCSQVRSSFTTFNSDTCTTGNYVHISVDVPACIIGRSSDQRVYRG